MNQTLSELTRDFSRLAWLNVSEESDTMRYSGFNVIKEALRGHKGWELAWRDATPKESYDYVIIRGSGHGLATACYLAKQVTQSRIAVLEKCWIGGGSVGRNRTIIRSNYLLDGNQPFYEFSLQPCGDRPKAKR